MPGRADLSIYQGDDYAANVVITHTDGTVADITGYTAKAQIRRGVADVDPDVVVEMSAVVDSPRVLLGIPHAETALLMGSYVWDLQLSSPDGVITTVLKGKVSTTAEVTRNGSA